MEEGAIKFHLNINLPETYAYATSIWIFNDRKQLVAEPAVEKHLSRTYRLEAGKYTVRIGINGQIVDNEVVISKDTRFDLSGVPGIASLAIPKLYSAALIADNQQYDSSHEYYTQPAIGISQIETFAYKRSQYRTSGLFIFLRYSDAETFKSAHNQEAYWNKFYLSNATGKVVVTFPQGCIQDDNKFNFNYSPGSGYIGFNACLKPGLYFLNYTGVDKRVIPIYVYPDWFTQFFMTVADQPLFGSIRIFIEKGKNYDPFNKNNLYIDYCLMKLQNNDFSLDSHLLEMIAWNKFDSPMLGLLGAYIYLCSSESKDDRLFKTIVENLQKKILKNSKNSPDIWALNLLSYHHFNETVAIDQATTIKGTPMLRVAYDTIRRWAITYPWLIPENSLNDHIAENQVFDSPFNTYKPFQSRFQLLLSSHPTGGKHGKGSLQIPVVNVLEIPNRKSFGFDGRQIAGFFKTSIKPSNSRSLQKSLDIYKKITSGPAVRAAVADIRLRYKGLDAAGDIIQNVIEDPQKAGWIGTYILNAIKDGEAVTPAGIAERLNMPLNTIVRILKELHIETSDLANISANVRPEINFWAKQFGVNPGTLYKAIEDIGESAEDLAQHFQQVSGSRSSAPAHTQSYKSS
jgi:hypothetical protein